MIIKNKIDELMNDYNREKIKYKEMYDYYLGNTNTMKNYKLTDRSNIKVSVNYIKKFIKEEVSYSLGNDITYISKAGDKEIIELLEQNLDISDVHDIELMKNMLIFGESYELAYITKDNKLGAKVLNPLNSYVEYDDYDNIVGFIHVREKDYGKRKYIDYYTKDYIYHYLNDVEIAEPTPNILGIVPVSVAKVSDEGYKDTIYSDIKYLVDAYEQCQSDICNEIADTRTAYLVASGCTLGDEQNIKEMKTKGILELPTTNSDIKWLTKNINDTFINNTLNNLEDKIYQITSHINHNESLSSNISGVALRSRLISLEERCKLNQRALTEAIKFRLMLVFRLVSIKLGIYKDYKDIKIKFTANIPQDDLNTAQIISQLGDKVSTETALSLLSFVENPTQEMDKISKENESYNLGLGLLNE